MPQALYCLLCIRAACDVQIVSQEFPEVGMALGLLMEEYGVQAYLCGHEHNLQYLHKEGERTHYIVSGGGSQVGNYGNGTGPDLLMFHAGSGKSLLSTLSVPFHRAPQQSACSCLLLAIQLAGNRARELLSVLWIHRSLVQTYATHEITSAVILTRISWSHWSFGRACPVI